MTLHVHTARISYGGADRLDVTRKSGTTVFAPTWRILNDALAARRRAAAEHRPEIEGLAWEAYVPKYVDEMRESYREHRAAWNDLLARETVTLVCYCVDAERCHRRLLAGILVKLGAVDMGERADG